MQITVMEDVLRIFRDLFTNSNEARNQVVQRLKEAKSAGVRIELEPVKSLSNRPPMIVVSIEDVDENKLIVSQPSPDAKRNLIRGKRYLLGFYDQHDRIVGHTICRGRIKQTLEGNRILYGYRFSIPESLAQEERRQNPRRKYTLGDEPEVQLTSFEHRSPIFGRVLDLSKGGMRINCTNGMNKLRVGQDVYLKMQLPPPVGLLTEMVRVIDLSPGEKNHDLTISVSFQAPVNALVELIDQNPAGLAERRAG